MKPYKDLAPHAKKARDTIIKKYGSFEAYQELKREQLKKTGPPNLGRKGGFAALPKDQLKEIASRGGSRAKGKT